MVQQWAKELAESVLGDGPFKVGDVVTHPDGRKVKIVSGQYWGSDGLCNFWHWREVLPNGKLSKEKENGYGW